MEACEKCGRLDHPTERCYAKTKVNGDNKPKELTFITKTTTKKRKAEGNIEEEEDDSNNKMQKL